MTPQQASCIQDQAVSPPEESTASTPSEKQKTHVLFLDTPTSSFCSLLFCSRLLLRDYDGLMNHIKKSTLKVPRTTAATATFTVVAGVSMRRFGIHRGAEWEEDVLSCAPYAAFLGIASSRRQAARTALHFVGFGITVFAADVAFKYKPKIYPQATPVAADNETLSSRPDN